MSRNNKYDLLNQVFTKIIERKSKLEEELEFFNTKGYRYMYDIIEIQSKIEEINMIIDYIEEIPEKESTGKRSKKNKYVNTHR